jgi:hypothetical protein
MTLFLVLVLVLAVVAIVASVRAVLLDGYRRVPRRTAGSSCPDRQWSAAA